MKYFNFKKNNDLNQENQKNNGSKDIKHDFDETNIYEIRNLNFWYDNKKKHALHDINLDIKKNKVTSFIGPSGCGKSTLLRCLNRMNDLILDTNIEGNIFFEKQNIYSRKFSVLDLRIKVGMVFQKPSPFPLSIYDNVSFALRNQGIRNKKTIDEIVEKALRGAALWDDVKNNLNDIATGLSGGQQQRLCIARAIACKPLVLLMDEPTSALDPIATTKIEELIMELSGNYTIIIVTHSMNQAQRVSDHTVFFYEGKIIETGKTRDLFVRPKEQKTKDYVNGRIG